jgi:hypothetical protein
MSRRYAIAVVISLATALFACSAAETPDAPEVASVSQTLGTAPVELFQIIERGRVRTVAYPDLTVEQKALVERARTATFAASGSNAPSSQCRGWVETVNNNVVSASVACVFAGQTCTFSVSPPALPTAACE